MYNHLFTDAWKLDRCIEASWIGSALYNPFVLAILLTILFFFIFTFWDSYIKKLVRLPKKYSSLQTTFFYLIRISISAIIGAVLTLPAMFMLSFMAIVIGFLVLDCSMGPLWERVRPAHEIHATLKKIREDGGQTPRSLEELKTINPTAYEKIEGKAKIEYEYLEEKDGYHFTVQPSKYLLADFSDENDFVMYRTESIVSPHIFKENPLRETK